MSGKESDSKTGMKPITVLSGDAAEELGVAKMAEPDSITTSFYDFCFTNNNTNDIYLIVDL
jgi:hypothetical protein